MIVTETCIVAAASVLPWDLSVCGRGRRGAVFILEYSLLFESISKLETVKARNFIRHLHRNNR